MPLSNRCPLTTENRMNLFRRRYLQQSIALAAGPVLAAPPRPHVVLLGDSSFDNGAYTGGKPDVIAHCRRVLPPGWQASLLARDGAVIEGVAAQLARLPPDATHLVLSAGGNDALQHQSLLQARASSVGDAIEQLAAAAARFESAYRKLLGACLARGLPLVVCTVYNGNFDDARYRLLTRSALALFNDAILRSAVEHKLNAIELRLVCTRAEDYANPIEPSTIGAAKIARAIAAAVTQTGRNPSACVLGAVPA